MQLTKRQFVQTVFAASAVSLLGSVNAFANRKNTLAPASEETKTMPFTLMPLPYDKAALEPHISAKTLEFHHGKHHQAYVTKLNELIAGTEMEKDSLEEIIKKSVKDESKKTVFNNAGQVWNHDFYWKGMKPNGGGKPSGAVAQKIDSDLGGYEKFKEDFKNAGITQFGSGWAWLVLDGGKLKITKTPNADLPMVHGQTALLTMDVWEHAYYLDYQNKRPDYEGTFIDHLINWDFVNENLAKAA